MAVFILLSLLILSSTIIYKLDRQLSLDKIKKEQGFKFYEWSGTLKTNTPEEISCSGMGWFKNETRLKEFLLSQRINLEWFEEIL